MAFNMSAQQLTVNGAISNPQGHPINKALVRAIPSGDTTTTDQNGQFLLQVQTPMTHLLIQHKAYLSQKVVLTGQQRIQVVLQPQVAIPIVEDAEVLEEAVMVQSMDMVHKRESKAAHVSGGVVASHQWQRPPPVPVDPFSNESYAEINENGYHYANAEPLSTFSIDVDRASYANVRRFLNLGQAPPKDAVRIEELINYFEYQYPSPKGKHPVAIQTELTDCPWNESHQLMKVGIKAQSLELEKLPPSSLVFLIDVSGSMTAPNKLPLLKSSMKMLVDQMRPQDQIAIVVYAGAAGLVLEPTKGSEKLLIKQAIDQLQAGGSTAGGAGINLAYSVAQQHFLKEGNNRIILATDGDFNVGASSDQAMEQLVESHRNKGVYLTVLGFGMGNYKDSKMEVLADKGNGNYAYIDNMKEAQKTLVSEFGSTMFTVAKDVKIQVEFNPAVVAEYRLIGYENRMLEKEDFNNDRKDAGEMGAGHVVTAIYEIVPIGASNGLVDPLKYQPQKQASPQGEHEGELATVKLRYKLPSSTQSQLMSVTVNGKDAVDMNKASDDMRWATSVAGFGMLLRESVHAQHINFNDVIAMAEGAKGADDKGYRAECIQLMQLAEAMQPSNTAEKQ